MDHRLDPKPKSAVEAEGANFALVTVIFWRDRLVGGERFAFVRPGSGSSRDYFHVAHSKFPMSINSNFSTVPTFLGSGVSIASLSLLAWLNFGGSTADAQSVYNVTSIGQPVVVNYGTGAGDILFPGSFSIGAGQPENFDRIGALFAGRASSLTGSPPAAVLGTSLTNATFTVSDLTLTQGDLFFGGSYDMVGSSDRLFNRLDLVVPRLTGTSMVQPRIFDDSEEDYVELYRALNSGKSFDFPDVRGSTTFQINSLFPQGGLVEQSLQIRQTTGTSQINTSTVQYKVQPGTVSPSSFTVDSAGSGGFFRWDLKGNTESGPGTNWTQINFADQVATFSAGTQFVIAFDQTTNFLDSFWSQSRSWDIFSGGTVTGAGADDFLANLNFTFIGGVNRPADIPNGYNTSHFSFDQTTGTLNWTAIPEPTSALSGILLAAGLMRRRRR
jgi:hypothetical protein